MRASAASSEIWLFQIRDLLSRLLKSREHVAGYQEQAGQDPGALPPSGQMSRGHHDLRLCLITTLPPTIGLVHADGQREVLCLSARLITVSFT